MSERTGHDGAELGAEAWAIDVRNVDLRTDVPHSARIYDYMLGGTDNFAPDRAAADEIARRLPNLRTSMRANRRFLARVARYMAGQLGIRQFLDVGTGLPTHPNLHEVVQAVDPRSRVVYVDNDPIVLVHARALLAGAPEGRTAYVDGDLRDPAGIFAAPSLRATLDLSEPVGLSLLAVLQFIEDDGRARELVEQLTAPLVPGSAVALTTVTGDSSPEEVARGAVAYRANGIPNRARSRAEIEALLTGFELVEPGVVLAHRWHPDEQEAGIGDEEVYMHGALAVIR
jgi:hypothetical protein